MAHVARTLGLAAAAAAALTLTLSACSNQNANTAASAGAHGFAASWGTAGPGMPSLTIAPDGSFNGTDGCNSLIGKGTISGQTFHFGHFATTLMACPDVDTWLSRASTATISGTTLTVKDADGTRIGTLDAR
ncbi:META domain-containing protein [Gryllotalpicola protaetiae]|uniref:META domain-containing protein n=1 Tax=Gryllotalpicola protaetiae TaxID=2419771 RepID=A0A387BS01_9MICO|nr:META domain-containing protein [Gryllotalpicola protaetiae]AYG03776.1 META domain-containing protein [Gryllotalpicola protaetiae]